MVICHRHKFIFVHNYKVAGTSIREALQVFTIPPKESYWNWLLQKTPLLPQSSDFPDHVNAPVLKSQLPKKIWDTYYKFSFTRNPWDWQVSLYHYARQQKDHHQHEQTMKMSYEEYLDWRVNHDLHLQKEFMYDAQDNCMLDYVGKMETLDEDFKVICGNIGITASLPHSNKSKHKPYQEYYNDRTRELVAQHFKEDIDLFGYTF